MVSLHGPILLWVEWGYNLAGFPLSSTRMHTAIRDFFCHLPEQMQSSEISFVIYQNVYNHNQANMSTRPVQPILTSP